MDTFIATATIFKRVAGSTQKEEVMFESIFGSWKTSAIGSVAGLPQILEGALTGNYLMLANGIFLVIFGLVSKDGNVSGVK